MKLSIVLGVVSVGIATVGAIYSIVSGKRYKQLCEKFDTCIDDLCERDDLKIDISERIINEAIDKAVDKQVKITVPEVENNVRAELMTKVSSEVKKEVNASYESIKSNVAREIKQQVGNIDISEVKKQVVADAKEEAAGRFRDELDGILNRFNDQLSDVKKIYSSIAKSFSDN